MEILLSLSETKTTAQAAGVSVIFPCGHVRLRPAFTTVAEATVFILKNKRMSFFKEFKAFALKGNVMDMAVGVIIGGAFGKIVSSLVNDILMPPIGALIGNTDFSQLRINISKIRDVTEHATHAVADTFSDGGDAAAAAAAAPAAEPIYWNYGAFIQQCVDFAILAFCVFLMVKLMNKLMKKKEEAPAPAPVMSKEEILLTEIRDLLKEQQKK